MQSAPPHDKEAQRLKELLRLEVLDTEDDLILDELTELASHICGTPISLISLIDFDRQWFKSRVGLAAHETPRELAFCAHAILQDDVFEVPNALEDKRFFDNPLVTDDPDIRFYAGAPLVTRNGLPIGTLCVIDKQPRHLNTGQKRALEILAHQVIGQLELRLNYKKLQRVDKEREKIFSVIGHDLRSPFTSVLGFAKRLSQKSHELSPEKTQDLANGVWSSALQVYQVLEELMQWTQQRIGRTHSDPKVRLISPMIDESIRFLNDGFLLKKITCVNQIQSDVSLLVDSAIFKTIIRNILANAIKYSPIQGKIEITFEAQENVGVVIIEDQGQGVPTHLLGQLFNDSVTSTPDTSGEIGTGIGLSLCAELVATQNGKIWVDPDYTQGARIKIQFPMQ
ncbi:hypothetical protein NBRC116188_27520 [Oceaniserpentilla sp. 4NH20-0058]|uniref:GAF domain-containing sensor histidine kinase n=1 Tax=Oceaniserpentilla sp. 4NH20-0058 TaxID=3127660 RepID=UPI00310A91FF